mgnify:CR=1 FL=1
MVLWIVSGVLTWITEVSVTHHGVLAEIPMTPGQHDRIKVMIRNLGNSDYTFKPDWCKIESFWTNLIASD